MGPEDEKCADVGITGGDENTCFTMRIHGAYKVLLKLLSQKLQKRFIRLEIERAIAFLISKMKVLEIMCLRKTPPSSPIALSLIHISEPTRRS